MNDLRAEFKQRIARWMLERVAPIAELTFSDGEKVPALTVESLSLAVAIPTHLPGIPFFYSGWFSKPWTIFLLPGYVRQSYVHAGKSEIILY